MENPFEELVALIGRLIARRHVRNFRTNAPLPDAAAVAAIDGADVVARDADSLPVASDGQQGEHTRP